MLVASSEEAFKFSKSTISVGPISTQETLTKAPCSCSNITIHGHRKTPVVNEGFRFVSFQQLSACLDVL